MLVWRNPPTPHINPDIKRSSCMNRATIALSSLRRGVAFAMMCNLAYLNTSWRFKVKLVPFLLSSLASQSLPWKKSKSHKSCPLLYIKDPLEDEKSFDFPLMKYSVRRASITLAKGRVVDPIASPSSFFTPHWMDTTQYKFSWIFNPVPDIT